MNSWAWRSCRRARNCNPEVLGSRHAGSFAARPWRVRDSDSVADWWARAFGLIGIAIAFAGFVLNYVKYRHDRPRLRTTAQIASVLSENRELWPSVVVSITNDGGADVRINRVSLGGGQLVGHLLQGPTMPFDLKARGGRSVWVFDYADMRDQLSELIRTQMHRDAPVRVQTSVRIGSQVLTPGQAAVYINPPGDHTYIPPPRSWRRRYRDWRREWSRPIPTLDPVVKYTVEDLEARQSLLTISNRLRRAAAPSELVLTVKHADDTREPVVGHPPIAVPRVPGRGHVEVAVPFVDDANTLPGVEFEWALRTQDGFGGQTASATVLSDVSSLREQVGQLRFMSLDRRDLLP